MIAALSPESYSLALQQRLCWSCSRPTYLSHAQQRQCGRCKHKWSFSRLTTEWELMQCFCQGQNANSAARRLGVAPGTSYKHFLGFEKILRQSTSPFAVLALDIVRRPKKITTVATRAATHILFSEIVVPRLRASALITADNAEACSRSSALGILL